MTTLMDVTEIRDTVSRDLVKVLAKAEDVAKRQPVRHLNYRGNVVPSIVEVVESGKGLGPNTMRELLYPVTAVYDVATDRTRVGLSFIAGASA